MSSISQMSVDKAIKASEAEVGLRLEEMMHEMTRRSAEADLKWEVMRNESDLKWTKMINESDKKFTAMNAKIDRKFTTMDAKIGKLEASVDKKFAAMDAKIDKMDASVDARLHSMNAKIDTSVLTMKNWFLGTILSSTLAILGFMWVMIRSITHIGI